METSGTSCGGLRKGLSPCELLGGVSGFLSCRCRGLTPCVESGRESEVFLSRADMDLGVLLESPQGTQSSSRVGACTCAFLPSGSSSSRFPLHRSRDLSLYLEVFPRGFPTGLSHVPPWCESILGEKLVAVQGKQVPLEWTETSGGLLEWWHDPGVPIPYPVESASS